jgi:putative phosphoribosyl transferase
MRSGPPYRNRAEAGERLASALTAYRGAQPLVLALPRGGVPIAAIVAARLGGDLDLLVVRKVGAPGNPEYGLGAVAEGGVTFLDRPRIHEFGLRPEELDGEVQVQLEEVTRLARRLRGARPPPSVRGRAVVLVDDGIATGGTVRGAVEATRLGGPAKVVVAVGVSSREAVRELRPRVDDFVCPLVPEQLYAVGEWYREFPQVSDEEVARLLAKHPSPDPTARDRSTDQT